MNEMAPVRASAVIRPDIAWTAQMVRPTADAGVGHPASFLRKSFEIDSPSGGEVLRISALGLYRAFINRMVKEAEANAEADKKQREAIEAKNQAESLIHSTEKSLKDYGDKVGVDEKTAIETALADLKGVLEGTDAEAIKDKTNALAEASMKLGEAMYKASQAEAEAKAAGGDKPADDDVVDADFEEVKDDKKSA